MTLLYETQNDAAMVRLTGVRLRQHGVGARHVGCRMEAARRRSELPERTLNMRKLMAVSLFLLLAACSAIPHAGHIPSYIGTASMLHCGGGLLHQTQHRNSAGAHDAYGPAYIYD